MLNKGDKPKNVRSYVVIRAKGTNPNDPHWADNIPSLKQVVSECANVDIDVQVQSRAAVLARKKAGGRAFQLTTINDLTSFYEGTNY
jgi:hypothetical protein